MSDHANGNGDASHDQQQQQYDQQYQQQENGSGGNNEAKAQENHNSAPADNNHLQQSAPTSSDHSSTVPAASSTYDRRAEQASAIPGEDGKLIIPTKLFVGALTPGVTDEQLRDFFSPYGEIVECRIQREKFTNESRKFGFVIYREAAAAAAAIAADQAAGGFVIDGKKINVRYAEAQGQSNSRDGGRDNPYRRDDGRERDDERARRDRDGYGGAGNASRDATKLFVGRLDPSITNEDLSTYFSKFGTVTECVIMRERGTGQSKGFAFLHFAEQRSQDECLAAKDHIINGFSISVEKSKPSSRPPAHRDDDRRGGYGGRDDRRGGDRYDDHHRGGGGYPPRDPRDMYGAPPPMPYGYQDPYSAYYAAAAAAQYGQYPGAGYGAGYGAPPARRDDRGGAPASARRDEYAAAPVPYAGHYPQQPQQSAQYPPQQQGYPASYAPQPYGQPARGYDDRSAYGAYGAAPQAAAYPQQYAAAAPPQAAAAYPPQQGYPPQPYR